MHRPVQPSNRPTVQPSNRPTVQPSNRPTGQPANRPTGRIQQTGTICRFVLTGAFRRR
ncbi:PT domain-containing protein [Burkholderia pyrrocinia]|uniref:PT domain-containing protein n=1 Tax=Burkholderia pyrrocinia TaxID=60550 RepID=UPI00215B1D47|nr:PT domain-containing protein [Burkholderia pyrrocinia]UVE69920.1 PT domain-containing protein [Burkholderia pyrrocinia]